MSRFCRTCSKVKTFGYAIREQWGEGVRSETWVGVTLLQHAMLRRTLLSR